MTVERTPSNAGLVLTSLASTIAVAGTLLAGWGIALPGIPLAVGGVYRTSRRVLAAGVWVLFLGTVVASATGVPTLPVLAAMTGTLLTWDLGENAISVAEQLRRQARSARIELVHAGTSSLVAVIGGGGTYAVYLLSTGSIPGVGLLLAVFGAVLVFAVFQR